MDGSLGLIEVLDVSTMRRIELEHCYRKDGRLLPGPGGCKSLGCEVGRGILTREKGRERERAGVVFPVFSCISAL